MVTIFVDTCVWRHWFTFKAKKPFKSPDLEKNAEAFDKIYEMVIFNPLKFVFLYNACIQNELKQYSNEFAELTQPKNFNKIPIPLSRADGTYLANGSILAGGNFGGTVKKILSLDGHDHEEAIQKTPPNMKCENPAHNKPRKKEFDIEHLESALEANANIFITTDQKLIDRLDRAKEKYSASEEIALARNTCFRPVDALSELLSKAN